MKNAEALNKGCACRTLDQDLLRSQLGLDPLLKGILEDINQNRPHLFSATTVFLSLQQLNSMTHLIEGIEAIIKLPAFQRMALDRAPSIAHKSFGTKGVFMGYDFHLSHEGPKLIEINTNAGGGLLNLELAKAQKACCLAENVFFESTDGLNQLDQKFYEMFIQEWKLQRQSDKPTLLAIVDQTPQEQYLYPEFILFERLLTQYGIKTIIADPKEFSYSEGKLWHQNQIVDMIYNRLTDFYLEEASHRPIANAYQDGNVVITPAPYHHAVYANKLNLVSLTNDAFLDSLGLSANTRKILKNHIPPTMQVSKDKSDEFWEKRKKLFFKPISGHGGKATYRGDKLTRKTWSEILKAQYVAQDIIPPSERVIQQGDIQTDLKIDIRAYVYNGMIQLLASRLYSGQTTNFRTIGGGFAPVFIVSDSIIQGPA